MAANSSQKRTEKEKQLTREISALKKDLSRKEKALAETAALLVLKKKPRQFRGSKRMIDKATRQEKGVTFNIGCL